MAKGFAHGYALLIGVDQNQVPQLALPDVRKDLRALYRVLADPQRCAYPPDQIELLYGEAATRAGILQGLAWLQAQLETDGSDQATAFIFYSGHGWRDAGAGDETFYLVPFDMEPGQYRQRALPAKEFAQAVEALAPQRLLVVLDCCHAAGMGVKDLLPCDLAPAAASPDLLVSGQKGVAGEDGGKLASLQQGQGRAVLSSSQGEQPSYLRRDGAMSIFTYHLVEALTGHARPQGSASEVLVSDLMGYVYRQVPLSAEADWGQVQTPAYRVTGNFPVSLLLGGRGLAGQAPPDPLAGMEAAAGDGPGAQIDAGGAYVGDSVDTGGGDFSGRDKIVYGDEERSEIETGDISGSGVAVGPGASVTSGDTYSFSGNFSGAILNVNATLNNVSQMIGTIARADDTAQAQLQLLVERLREILQEIPPAHGELADAVAQLTQSLVEAAAAERPNKTVLRISGHGLQEAAADLAPVAPSLPRIVKRIVETVGEIVAS